MIRVKPAPAVQPGQVIVYHACGYGPLRYRMFSHAPSHGPRGTTVEVEHT